MRNLRHRDNRRQQAVAATAESEDIAGVARIIAERIAQQLDPLADRFRRNNQVCPNLGHQFIR